MPTVLSALAPTLFQRARIVPRELTGILGAVRRDFDAIGVHQGGTVKVPVIPRLTAGSTPAPSQTFAAAGSRTIATADFTLNQTAEVKWDLTAEQERQLMIGGTYTDTLLQTVDQGWRSLRNQIEAYLGVVAKSNASRAVGAAGTTPFASNADLLVDARKILIDNGSQSRRSAIFNTAAEANLIKLPGLQRISEAGDKDVLREGLLGRLFGIDLAASQGIAAHVKGTGASYTSTAAGFAVGTTSIPLITGTGTVLAGDCVTFAGDANVYVVKTGVAAPGTIELQEPGLVQALPASAQAMTIGNASADNLVLGENSMVAVVRPALQPVGALAEQMIIADEVTKISALFLRVVGDGMTTWYMRQVYDAFAPNPYEIVKLRG